MIALMNSRKNEEKLEKNQKRFGESSENSTEKVRRKILRIYGRVVE